jgi:hypothetical protein
VNPAEVRYWRQAAVDLGLDIVTPFERTFADGARMVANALVRNFGATIGMVADDRWAIIEPFSKILIDCGYGFSVVNIGPKAEYKCDPMIDMLADWTWSGDPHLKPSWLPARRPDSESET